MRIGFPLLWVLLMACALAPGMRMDEGAAEARGRAHTKNGEYRVELITPTLLTKLAEQGARENSRIADPDSNAPGAYTVAPYDVLQVTVWDHPELTAPTGQFRSRTVRAVNPHSCRAPRNRSCCCGACQPASAIPDWTRSSPGPA